jgi:hypothetical protein
MVVAFALITLSPSALMHPPLGSIWVFVAPIMAAGIAATIAEMIEGMTVTATATVIVIVIVTANATVTVTVIESGTVTMTDMIGAKTEIANIVIPGIGEIINVLHLLAASPLAEGAPHAAPVAPVLAATSTLEKDLAGRLVCREL